MDRKEKHALLITLCGVVLFAALMNLDQIGSFAEKVISLILPVIVGGIIALFLNVPMNGIQKRIDRLFRSRKKKPPKSLSRICSFFITLICVVLILILVCTLLVPELVRSGQSLYYLVKERVPSWLAYLDSHNVNAAWLEELTSGVDFEKMMQEIPDGVGILLGGVTNAISSTISVAVTIAFALIIAIYMALGKEQLCRHSRKLAYAYLKPSWADKLTRFCNMFSQSFAKFLSGQCVEATILGMLMFFAFMIFRLPYASLVGVFTAVCAIIPYVGAFFSFAVSAFLTLLVDPALVIKCMIVYGVVQFTENQFIYPRVVGGSVGLSPLYTLIAALIGGRLFGILGILFAIPLAAVFYEIIRSDIAQRAVQKN